MAVLSTSAPASSTAPKIVRTEPAGPAGAAGSRGITDNLKTGTEQPVLPVKLVPAPSTPDPLWTVGGAILGATFGALVAQGVAARIARGLRRRTERVDAFDRAFYAGLQARAAIAQRRVAMSRKGDDYREELRVALLRFRAAEASYSARFSDKVAAMLAAACAEASTLINEERSDAEIEALADLVERYADEIEAYEIDPQVAVSQARDEHLAAGVALEEALFAIVRAFGEETTRWKRRRGSR